MEGPCFYDMHCHLDFAPNALEAAERLDTMGCGAFAVSVLPNAAAGCAGIRERRRAASSLVRWGVGLHPWWVADGRAGDAEVEEAEAAVETNVYVGEVGLDFGKTHGKRIEEQLRAFDSLARACARAGGRVLSVHAVRAADAALDILDAAGALGSCACVFHWFSDSSDAFARAVRSGCYFSVGELMLRSKRGREYARQVPANRLLLETDAPAEGEHYDVGLVQERLARTCADVAQLRGADAESIAERVGETSRFLLSCE